MQVPAFNAGCNHLVPRPLPSSSMLTVDCICIQHSCNTWFKLCSRSVNKIEKLLYNFIGLPAWHSCNWTLQECWNLQYSMDAGDKNLWMGLGMRPLYLFHSIPAALSGDCRKLPPILCTHTEGESLSPTSSFFLVFFFYLNQDRMIAAVSGCSCLCRK